MRILEKWQKADPLYGMETHYITEKEIEALMEGKRLYFDVNEEYAVVIKFKSQEKTIEREKKIPESLKIEQDTSSGNYYIKNEHGTKCYLTKHSKIIVDKINEILDYLKSEGK